LPLILGTASAFSATHEDSAAEFSKAKVSIVKAIRTAERHERGHAMSAEFELMDGKPVYKVDVLNKDSKAMEITVDARSGKVLSTRADTHETMQPTQTR
jgi:uncharacterized membrane protein YkoI